MADKRVRKKSKRLSESSSLYEDDEPPKKRTRRTKSIANDDNSSSGNNKLTKKAGSKKFIVSLDFTNNNHLSLGGVPLAQLSPIRVKGSRSRRSASLASTISSSVQEEIVVGKPEKTNFKNPKFCFSYLAGNKKKSWKNFKQIMTAEKSLPWGPDDPRYSSLDAPPLLKPARKYSDLSGLLAKYTDPLTGLYYSTAEEFQLIRTLTPDIIQSYLALRGKMPIWLKNFQRKVLFNENLLKLHSNFFLHLLGVGHFDVSVACLDSQEMQHLNKVYCKKDVPTDVLSFRYHQIAVPGVLPNVVQEWDRNLGDIVLGIPVIEEACRSDGVKFADRLPVIIAHGLCHLIGHCHSNPERWKKMYQAERKLLTSFNLTFGTELKPLTAVVGNTNTM